MTLGNQIAFYRKQKGLTQEALAARLELSNQAVSKWESDICCPDVMLLPRLADIFGVTIDELFGREPKPSPQSELPWNDDETLHAVLFVGHRLIGENEPQNERFTFEYEGPALDIYCACNLQCGNVEGNVNVKKGNVTCCDVGGDVNAGGVTCCDVAGDVNAGNVTPANVMGDVSAGSVSAAQIMGDVQADNVTADEIMGDVKAQNFYRK